MTISDRPLPLVIVYRIFPDGDIELDTIAKQDRRGLLRGILDFFGRFYVAENLYPGNSFVAAGNAVDKNLRVTR